MITRIGVIGFMLALLQAIAAWSASAQVRTLTAWETTGLPHDMTSASDSGFGPVCKTANEDLTACFGTPYLAPKTLFSGTGSYGVNLCDSFDNCNTTKGTDRTNTISDQLYLLVQDIGNANNFQVTWCWDSDLEPNVNICQGQINPTVFDTVLEHNGFNDLTAQFTSSSGLLAPGEWKVVALSEAPEPATWVLMALGFAGLGLAGYRSQRTAIAV